MAATSTKTGDMLLFQWGINDWGNGPALEINITRQLIATDDDGDEPRPTPACSFASMRHWLPGVSRAETSGAKSQNNSRRSENSLPTPEALRIVANETPESVELQFGRT